MVYFSYTALLAAAWRAPARVTISFTLLPLIIALLASVASKHGAKAAGVAREWIAPAFLLPAYWQVNWFYRPHNSYAIEHRWLAWDRIVLDQWHVRALIESFGALFPSVLEISYLLIYSVPAVALAILYRNHLRRRIHIFFVTFFAGTLTTYALLPWFPSESPRVMFPGQDLPAVYTLLHRVNVSLLDCCDIQTSVFPSGHVTAAFSAAFGMLLAFPEKKRYGALMTAYAAMIATATVYARYHYSVDALAGLGISAAVYGCMHAWRSAAYGAAVRSTVDGISRPSWIASGANPLP